jgi:hypothetical protein
MHPEAYQRFSQTLLDRLSNNPAVLGLVALGSMAERDYGPDRWSDHDFFVITEDGQETAFRDDLSWLPDTSDIVLAVRDTEHGSKVIYRNGHLVEFAVFTLEQLEVARINRYRVLVDRADIGARMARLQKATARYVEDNVQSDHSRIGQFLALLLVGTGRYRRGERLSGARFVHQYALDHLLALLIRHLPVEGEPAGLLDDLDPTRRFERSYPRTGAALAKITILPVPEAAQALLDLAQHELGRRVPDFPSEASMVIRAQLQLGSA